MAPSASRWGEGAGCPTCSLLRGQRQRPAQPKELPTTFEEQRTRSTPAPTPPPSPACRALAKRGAPQMAQAHRFLRGGGGNPKALRGVWAGGRVPCRLRNRKGEAEGLVPPGSGPEGLGMGGGRGGGGQRLRGSSWREGALAGGRGSGRWRRRFHGRECQAPTRRALALPVDPAGSL